MRLFLPVRIEEEFRLFTLLCFAHMYQQNRSATVTYRLLCNGFVLIYFSLPLDSL